MQGGEPSALMALTARRRKDQSQDHAADNCEHPWARCKEGLGALRCRFPKPLARRPDRDTAPHQLNQGSSHQGPYLEITGMRDEKDPQMGGKEQSLIHASGAPHPGHSTTLAFAAVHKGLATSAFSTLQGQTSPPSAGPSWADWGMTRVKQHRTVLYEGMEKYSQPSSHF